MAISLPLDSTAVGQADDVLYCANQHEPALFDGQGGRLPLSATDPDQQHLRDMWCELYEDIVAHNRDGSRPFPACGMGHPHHPGDCGHCAGTAPPADAPSTNPPQDDPTCDPVGPVEECPLEDELPPEPTIRIRASMFFDGTGNNRTNVDLGAGANDSDSYGASHSNVSLLEAAGIGECDPELTEHFSLYVEGPGTTNRGDDDNRGSATGTGTTGVKEKVHAGVNALLARIRAIATPGGDPIEYIHLDAFGFSRGAAGARFFVHYAVNDAATAIKTVLTNEGYDVGEVKVKFLGLYDTVASYGAAHYNDTADLSLDAISVAERVVQLSAAEEHRVNFRLTNINSAGGKGTHIYLPGVHSDVGGGYATTSDEDDLQIFDIDSAGWNSDEQEAAILRERTWLLDSGWYLADQIADTNFWNEVHVTRRNLPNTYQRIPLHIMATYARMGGVPLSPDVENASPIPSALRTAHTAITTAVSAGSCGTPRAWFGNNPAVDPAWHKTLRNTHLHFSSYYQATYGQMHPQFTGDDPVNGRRQRIVQNG
ncbi:MAG: hypothetical protein ACJAVR_001846 [Paracoccaceae bacterium]|jgi:hypothetical protein